ncbi:ArsB/NhaD family transporter [Faecalicatena contorta]|uniref:ArsB/NhaD family transporter n=1 Tax=Faecalicatena fissicatena TaxID=290055 RepID=A0ABS2E4Y3_9FIRM|nr:MULTISPECIES: ArsB/NhaD family transporter [Clostridia]MBM6684163.1 ArsB/NhaD family transporter [Faecalicatena contorta]MBM6709525.1 ArsB/NhaD family transporter [Faecalicatena contorta]MBM6736668.1 ArsB/NhaD family transporter [Faecalicatena fissicatena]HIX99971.1 ArsB/NhaD family transporter [Candidatus Dorea intestinigallinarum]
MNTEAVISVLVFLLVMAAIISEKVHRSVAAMAGAVILLLFHVLSIEEATSYVDINTIGVLVGMMLFVAVVKNSGLFEYVAIKAAKLTKGRPMAIMVVFAVITALLSAFLDNVTTVLLIGPMTIAITQMLEVNPIPYLLSQIMASNIGGTATLIGDPPNIMIGSAAGLSFVDFVINTGSVIVIIMAVTVVIYYFMYRSRISVVKENMQKVMELDEDRSIKDKPLLIKSVIMTIVVVIGFVFHSQLQVESATVAMFAAGFMLIFGKQDAEEIILGVEWSTILFFIGLFVVVGGLQKSGVISSMAEVMVGFIGNNEALGIIVILWVSAIISSFLDNIPFVATLIPLILTMESSGVDVAPLWWALSLGACLGGNGTLIGASANVVLAGVSSKNGYPITFMQYTKIGFPLMLISILISMVYLLLRFA